MPHGGCHSGRQRPGAGRDGTLSRSRMAAASLRPPSVARRAQRSNFADDLGFLPRKLPPQVKEMPSEPTPAPAPVGSLTKCRENSTQAEPGVPAGAADTCQQRRAGASLPDRERRRRKSAHYGARQVVRSDSRSMTSRTREGCSQHVPVAACVEYGARRRSGGKAGCCRPITRSSLTPRGRRLALLLGPIVARARR